VSALALIIAGAVAAFGSLTLASQFIGGGVAEADLSCAQKAAEFEGYALIFAGDDYDGLPVRGCNRVITPEKYNVDGTVREPAMDFFVFSYGDCAPTANESSCARPVQIIVDPRCGPKLHDSIKAEMVLVRGLEVTVKVDGSVRIETDSYSVSVFAPKRDYGQAKSAALDVVESLRGANHLAADLTVDKPLAEPAAISLPIERNDPCKNAR